jgi:hypothetical protein
MRKTREINCAPFNGWGAQNTMNKNTFCVEEFTVE